MVHLAKSVGVAASMVGIHSPLHLLLRPSQPFSHRYFPRPIVLFRIFSKSESTTVGARAAVPKIASAIKIAAERPATKGATRTGYGGSSWGVPWVFVLRVMNTILSFACEVVLLHMFGKACFCVPILLTVMSPSIVEVGE